MTEPAREASMNRVVEVYKKLIILAEKRDFNTAESEILTAMMMASNIAAAEKDQQKDVWKRLHEQATEFLEIGLMIKEGDDET